MFSKLFKKTKPVFEVPEAPKADRRAMEIAYARLFGTEDGRRVLNHLQAATFLRTYAADAPEGQLRYSEGQRALVTTILRMIEAGRRPA